MIQYYKIYLFLYSINSSLIEYYLKVCLQKDRYGNQNPTYLSLRPSRHIASHHTGCVQSVLLISANVESTLLHFIFDVTLYTNALNLYEYNSKYLPDSYCCYRVNRDCVFRCPRSKFPSPSLLSIVHRRY